MRETDTDRIRAAQEIISAEQDRPHFGTIVAIDPFACECTECITNIYVPLRWATDAQLVGMILGELENHTGHNLSDFQVQDDGSVIRPEGNAT